MLTPFKGMVMIIIGLCLFCFSILASAETPVQPQSDTVFTLKPELATDHELNLLLAKLRNEPTDTNRLKLARFYLTGAKRPGFSDWQHYAEALIAKISTDKTTNVEYLLLLSDIKQQQHHFSEALVILQDIFMQQPGHLQASLMAARIHLATDQPVLAQQACNRLISKDIFLSSVCSYEVLGRMGKWQQAYELLMNIYTRYSEMDTELMIWIQGILAEQAEQLGYYDTALAWLTPILDIAPTSLWLKWADLSLATDNPQSVYDKLSNLEMVDVLEDSLLLRLAIAEQRIGKMAVFQEHIHERMTLRVLRQDQDHAADLVHYFLFLKPDAAQAYKWAKINFNSAKEPDDKKLLELSQQALVANRQEE